MSTKNIISDACWCLKLVLSSQTLFFPPQFQLNRKKKKDVCKSINVHAQPPSPRVSSVSAAIVIACVIAVMMLVYLFCSSTCCWQPRHTESRQRCFLTRTESHVDRLRNNKAGREREGERDVLKYTIKTLITNPTAAPLWLLICKHFMLIISLTSAKTCSVNNLN